MLIQKKIHNVYIERILLKTHVTNNPQVKFESSRAVEKRPWRTSVRRAAHSKTEGELRCRGPLGRRSEAIGGGPSETGCGNEMCASAGFRSTRQIKFTVENLRITPGWQNVVTGLTYRHVKCGRYL